MHPKCRSCHALKHLPEKAGINWLYKCKLCGKYKCLYISCAQRYVKNKHKIKRAEENVHFIKNVEINKEIIARVKLLAFPSMVMKIKSQMYYLPDKFV